jgi:glycosyltransferase involved in cell wall biosynthesis
MRSGGAIEYARAMRRSPLAFVLPAQHGLISGGNIYNERLIDALAALTGPDLNDAPDSNDAPDLHDAQRPVRTLTVAEGQAAMRAGAPGTYFIDTLNLGDFIELLAQPHARQRRILIVHHLPSLEPGIDPDDPALAIERATLPRFDGFLTTSSYTTALLRERGHTTQDIMTVPPALSARDRQALRCPPGVRALLVGNLIPRKGVLPLLHALDAAVTPDDRFDIDVVGGTVLDPDYAGACARLVASSPRLGPRVHLRGEVAHAEMDAYYGAASVVISASSMETFGMALQEARAWGLPILALDGGNARNHFAPGQNGALHGTVPALVHGFLALVRDPAHMQRLFACAQDMRAGAGYTWDVAARALLDQLAGQPDAGS